MEPWLNYKDSQLFGIDILFTDLRNYQNLIEGFLLEKKSILKKDFDETDLEIESKKAGENANRYYEHLIDSYSERHHEISRLFPHNFRASFLTQVISVIETELKRICDHYGAVNKQLFTVDEMQGTDDLEKCKTFLKKISNIDFRKFDQEWQYIKKCKALRNKIVHQDGRIKNENKDLIKFVENHESVDAERAPSMLDDFTTFMIVNKKLIDDLLSIAQTFFNKLLEEKLEFKKLH